MGAGSFVVQLPKDCWLGLCLVCLVWHGILAMSCVCGKFMKGCPVWRRRRQHCPCSVGLEESFVRG